MFRLRRNQRRRCNVWICDEQIVSGGSAAVVEDIAGVHVDVGTIAGNGAASSSVPITGSGTVRFDFSSDVAVKQNSTARAGILIPYVDRRVSSPRHRVRYQYVIASDSLARSIGDSYAALPGVVYDVAGERSRTRSIVHY